MPFLICHTFLDILGLAGRGISGGTLTADPELRHRNGGTPAARMQRRIIDAGFVLRKRKLALIQSTAHCAGLEIERRLKEVCDIPVFHDDQHGTAVVTCAALINACKLTGRELGSVKAVFSGAGAAGISIARLMRRMGVRDIVICDRKGAIYEGREGLNPVKEEVASWTNREHVAGTLADAVRDADVFVGVSAPGALTQDMVRSMAKDAIVFACANPVPEIMPDEALAAGAAVAATGRSDFPNQINNVLAFPGIFRGALDVRASDINDDMMEAAAYAIAGLVDDEHRSAEYVIPGAFDQRVAPAVAAAVAEAARKSGVARL